MKKQSLFLALAISSTIPIFSDEPPVTATSQSTLSRRPRVPVGGAEFEMSPEYQQLSVELTQVIIMAKYYMSDSMEANAIKYLEMAATRYNENSTPEQQETGREAKKQLDAFLEQKVQEIKKATEMIQEQMMRQTNDETK
jgi:hypothetical protein